ncbi:U4/U6 X U5 tri-snRNP complex subunit Snu23 [Schizosaccharomyces cryophilus OY26]|uniref:U4/U6 X U5 tri-snRNP complex subunit Snu23 n=1 Tax=Schizosaccharomyces cryophilus (strain OY26 / ATCC MYA-4695 / CBS 11777 / NBRC 106824 / NRRL Y48691) TaxID=653667 RepID=S9XAM9_SCHCR|nr:U4/U6 X U5 tri-snRNP complex subunit Snu23 [Schizosaccharomyces cryophilus OY26]EPY54207.1 U4/U6 X U5 tri-snRNP complex subunit Snu23 [Schizosaccharomyces cryophilus OY26]
MEHQRKSMALQQPTRSRQPKIVGARSESVGVEKDINKVKIVPANASFGRRGHGAGWYCEACNETYKDSLSWIEHLNSTQHLRKTRTVVTDKRATLEEVKERMEYWREQLLQPQVGSREYNLRERTDAYKQELRKQKLEKQAKKEQQAKQKMKEPSESDNSELANIMGIRGFGSTSI